jgi:hypothetical protein
VADLGNGLGIDSNGQMYVPASAVEQSMLAFDTATQGELDNHASNAGAHHSRYSDSEARQATDGQIDAETVDGQHASELGSDLQTVQYHPSVGAATETFNLSGQVAVTNLEFVIGKGTDNPSATVNFADGGSHSYSWGNTSDSSERKEVDMTPLDGHSIDSVQLSASDDGYYTDGPSLTAEISGVKHV